MPLLLASNTWVHETASGYMESGEVKRIKQCDTDSVAKCSFDDNEVQSAWDNVMGTIHIMTKKSNVHKIGFCFAYFTLLAQLSINASMLEARLILAQYPSRFSIQTVIIS